MAEVDPARPPPPTRYLRSSFLETRTGALMKSAPKLGAELWRALAGCSRGLPKGVHTHLCERISGAGNPAPSKHRRRRPFQNPPRRPHHPPRHFSGLWALKGPAADKQKIRLLTKMDRTGFRSKTLKGVDWPGRLRRQLHFANLDALSDTLQLVSGMFHAKITANHKP